MTNIRRFRKRKGNAKETLTADNRIMVIKDNKEIIKSIGQPKFDLLLRWLDYRKDIKKEITVQSTLQSLIDRIKSETLKKCELVIQGSIENGWQGLFWDKFIESTNNIESNKNKFNSPIL